MGVVGSISSLLLNWILFLDFEKGTKSFQWKFDIISSYGISAKKPAFLKYHVGLKSYAVQSRCSFYFLLRNYADISPTSFNYMHLSKI